MRDTDAKRWTHSDNAATQLHTVACVHTKRNFSISWHNLNTSQTCEDGVWIKANGSYNVFTFKIKQTIFLVMDDQGEAIFY